MNCTSMLLALWGNLFSYLNRGINSVEEKLERNQPAVKTTCQWTGDKFQNHNCVSKKRKRASELSLAEKTVIKTNNKCIEQSPCLRVDQNHTKLNCSWLLRQKRFSDNSKIFLLANKSVAGKEERKFIMRYFMVPSNS